MGFKKEDFVIGVIGRIDEQKGQLELLKAFSRISKKFGSTHLMIIGEATLGEPKQEAYFQHLKNQVTKNNLDKRVHFIGFQKDTRKYFANFDLFVLPSHEETFGFVVVEAMASGTPVLVTQAGGPPEIVQDGECGFLCQPKDWESIEEQLDFILSNTDIRTEKTQKALVRARDFYDRKAVYKNFMKILNK